MFFSKLNIAFLAAMMALPAVSVHAGELDVPVMERASDGLDTCSFGQVTGLKAGGDGFLAVRSGPSTRFRKIDEIYNGDKVWLFEQRGKWIGIVYGISELGCDPVDHDRIVPHRGKKGWVHENWIIVLAG